MAMAKAKAEIEIVFEPDFDMDAPRIFSDVEREIIRADMAFLKQQEIDSGDWAKWEKSQRPFKNFERIRESQITRRSRRRKNNDN
jgi:hypothetical protein